MLKCQKWRHKSARRRQHRWIFCRGEWKKPFWKWLERSKRRKGWSASVPKQSENKTKPWVQQKRKPAETENKPRESICNLFHKQASCYRCVSLKSFPNPLISWKKRAKDLKRKLTRKEMQLISDFWSPKQREYSFAVSAAQLWSFAKAALGS